MRITKLSLTNFRSFKETQEIDLAPVTLLFGPNSVGKSSILMALAYIQQILKKGHCNPQKLDAIGDKKIGGFRSLVYGQDLSKTIRLKVRFEPDKTPFVDYDAEIMELSLKVDSDFYLLMDNFGANIDTGEIEFEIAWSERHQWAFVENLIVWVNEEFVGRINSSEDLKKTSIVELNTYHKLLMPYDNDEWLEHEYGPKEEWEEPLDSACWHSHFEKVLSNINPNIEIFKEISDDDGALVNFVNRVAPISISCRTGAIPHLGQAVVTNLDGQDWDDVTTHLEFLAVRETLSQAFVLPLDKLLEHLERSILIGPLRVVPDIDYSANPHPEQKDWVDGSAAWDLLYRDPNKNSQYRKLLASTSQWFSDEKKLNSGYELINHSLEEEIETHAPFINATPGILDKRHLFFRDKKSSINLSANQLGTGISQVLPLVVAANEGSLQMISVEQPELHIHPRFQTELADLFLETKNDHSYLIETHSEHLILRLLRRIRQTTDEELPEGVSKTSPDSVSIVYLEPSEEGVQAKRIRVDEDGEFKERWPQGFFNERREELM